MIVHQRQLFEFCFYLVFNQLVQPIIAQLVTEQGKFVCTITIVDFILYNKASWKETKEDQGLSLEELSASCCFAQMHSFQARQNSSCPVDRTGTTLELWDTESNPVF